MQLKEMSGQAQGIPFQQVGSERFGFSPGGHELASTSNDGRLAVWDAKVNQIKHEFIPSAHLSAACTCLSWMPPSSPKSPSKSRKRKTSTSSGTGGSSASVRPNTPTRSDAIAIGTSTGAVLIYSLKTGDVTSHLSKEHAPHRDQVNDIVWDSSGIAIFTVSNDGHVCNINVRKSAVIYKFRGSLNPDANVTEALTSICLHPSEQSVLVGSLSKLTWWDLDTRSVLKVFEGGHVGSATSLAVATSSLNNCYVISGGSNLQKDHTLTVWKLSLDDQEESSSKKKNKSSKATEPCAKLSINDSARTVFVAEATAEDVKRKRKSSANESEEDLVFGAVTRSGVLHCFRQNLLSALNSGSRKKKPIKADHVVQIATEKGSGGHVTNLPILDARFRDANSIDVAYGTKMMPAFETLEISSMEKSACLVRNSSPNVAIPKGDSNHTSNLVVPDTSGTKVMAPGPTMVEPQAGTKRKQPGGDKSLSMVDRLKLLSRDKDQKTTPPRTDSMIQLLLQGLHNQDRRILNSVLDRADDSLITNTVRRLPVEGVVPLIQELQHYIKGRGIVNQSHSRWLESTLQIHAAHLISLPHCEELLGPIYAMLEARTKNYNSLLLLKGKLDIMTKQITTKPDPDAEKETLKDKKALLVYQDDSGDELNEKMDDLLLPPSDTDDNWIVDEESDGEEEEDEAKKQSEEESDDSEVDLVENGDEDMDSDD